MWHLEKIRRKDSVITGTVVIIVLTRIQRGNGKGHGSGTARDASGIASSHRTFEQQAERWALNSGARIVPLVTKR